jgi:hypothetical protein
MDKMKILILLALVAVVIWYFSQETKPTQSLIASQKKSVLPVSLPKYSSPSPSPQPSVINSPPYPAELTDYGWLTDDNLEFILKNHAGIQAALQRQNQSGKVFHLRTDIANIYNAFYKAKSKQVWDLADFCEELERNKARYLLFPLRVNGNHWGLVILTEREKELEKKPVRYEPNMVYLPGAELVELVKEVYYTSSGGGDLEEEKEQIKPWVEQVCGVGTEIKVIYPADRDSKGYECGVYVVFYIQELLETGKLELKRQYTSVDCQNFRHEWKERIGGRWCKRD